MSNAEMNSYLVPVLIVITLGALAWAALQNYFFNAVERRQNRYNYPYPPPYYPPQGSDYPQHQTPRSGSPMLTLIFIIVVAIGLYYFATGGFPEFGATPEKAYEPLGTSERRDDSLSSLGLIDFGHKPDTKPQKTYEDRRPVDEYYEEEPPAPEAPKRRAVSEADYTTQVAALETKASVVALTAKLAEAFGAENIFLQVFELEPGAEVTRIMVGHFEDRKAAMKFAKKLKKLGYGNCQPITFGKLWESGDVNYYQP